MLVRQCYFELYILLSSILLARFLLVYLDFNDTTFQDTK